MIVIESNFFGDIFIWNSYMVFAISSGREGGYWTFPGGMKLRFFKGSCELVVQRRKLRGK